MSDDRYKQPRRASDAGSEILPVSERLYNRVARIDRETADAAARARREARLKGRRTTRQAAFDRRTNRLRQAGVDKYGPRVLDGTRRLRAKGPPFDMSPNAKRPK